MLKTVCIANAAQLKHQKQFIDWNVPEGGGGPS